MSLSGWRPAGFIERIGAALLAPREAVAAADEKAASEGRTGSDVALLIGLVFAAVYTHVVVAAVWLAVDESFVNALVVLFGALARNAANDLAFVFIAGVALTLAAGRRRSFGRDIDLAFVAYVPIALVRLAAELSLTLAGVAVSSALSIAVAVLAYGWAGLVLYFAWQQTRSRTAAAESTTGAGAARAASANAAADDDPERTGVTLDMADETERTGVTLDVLGDVVNPAAVEPTPSAARGAARTEPPRIGVRAAGWLTLAMAAGLAALNGVGLARDLDSVRPVSLGTPAPSFHLHAVDARGAVGGQHLSSDELRGQVVLLDFWATWCGPCIDAMPDLAALDASYRDHGLRIISINMDNAAKARATLRSLDIDLPLYVDDGTTADKYKVTTIPHLVLIDRDGDIRYVQRGKLGHGGLRDALAELFSHAHE
ncbi:MAG: hypothetical protein Tsb0020_35940 [Haliangiales bacterium]